MTIVRLGANVVSSSPAARQFFFMFFTASLSSSIYSGVGTDLVDSRELSGMGT